MFSTEQRRKLEQQRLDEFHARNNAKQRFAHIQALKEPQEQKDERHREEQLEEQARTRYYENHRAEMDKDHDKKILDKLVMVDLRPDDKELIDDIEDDKLRSGLQHKHNLQMRGFHKTVVKNTPEITVLGPRRRRGKMNKTYSDLVKKYPELQDDPTVLLSGGKLKITYVREKSK